MTEAPMAGAVWASFGAELRRFLLRRLPSESDAEDVLQEVFFRLHAKGGEGAASGSVRGWLFQVARNAIADFYRARGARPEEALPEGGVDVAGEAEGTDAAAALAPSLAGFLGALPDGYREAVFLAEVEGLDQRTVAARLGLSLSGAKSRIQRGRDLLRRRLEECCHVELDRRGRVIAYEERCCCCAKAPKRR